jgi:pyruvate/2-oxoglutarate dehydrogenase complex dihydrolipoamide dehydrogenase (E3) component
VNGEMLEAPKIFINVGARPVLPSWKGIADVPVLNNTSMMAVDTLPEHLLVVGGSYIGLEFAQMYRRFGSRVTVLEFGDRLIAREDREVSAEIQRILEREGVAFHFSVKDATVARGAGGSGVRVVVDPAGQALAIEGSHLLAAIGRRPNTDASASTRPASPPTPAASSPSTRRFHQRARRLGAGRRQRPGAFTHTSYNDFQIVAGNLLDGETRRVGDRIPIYALFIDPPLGRVGMSEAEVRARGKPALSA